MASLARTVASLARTVPKPFPTKSVHSPFGVQKIYTARGEAPSLRMDGLGGWDGRGNKSVLQFFVYFVSI